MYIKNISSAQTFWMKVVLPAIWIFGFGIATLSMWWGFLHDKDNTPPPDEIKFIFTLVWIAGAVAYLWAFSVLKRVQVDDKHLYVSNYLREIPILLNDIINITENCWVNYHPITIYFRNTTEFGDKITFMPKMRYWGYWRPDPIVAELKQLAGLEK